MTMVDETHSLGSIFADELGLQLKHQYFRTPFSNIINDCASKSALSQTQDSASGKKCFGAGTQIFKCYVRRTQVILFEKLTLSTHSKLGQWKT